MRRWRSVILVKIPIGGIWGSLGGSGFCSIATFNATKTLVTLIDEAVTLSTKVHTELIGGARSRITSPSRPVLGKEKVDTFKQCTLFRLTVHEIDDR